MQTLTLEELAAEKVRVLRTRAKPRDLFDIWYLHKHGHFPEEKKIKKKMSLYPEGETLDDPLSEVKKDWESDLSVLLRQTPPLEKVIDDLSGLLDTF